MSKVDYRNKVLLTFSLPIACYKVRIVRFWGKNRKKTKTKKKNISFCGGNKLP